MGLNNGLWLPREKPEPRTELDPFDSINRRLTVALLCNEGQGSVLRDASHFKNDAAMSSMGAYPWTPQDRGGLALSNANGGLFDGVINGFDLSSQGWTQRFRLCFPSAPSGNLHLGGLGSNSQPIHLIRFQSHVYIWGNNRDFDTGVDFLTGWQTVTVSNDGVKTRVYLNKTLIGSQTSTYGGESAQYNIFGPANGFTSAFLGKFDLYTVHQRVLSLAEICRYVDDPYAGYVEETTPSFRVVGTPATGETISIASPGALAFAGATLGASFGYSAGVTGGVLLFAGKTASARFGYSASVPTAGLSLVGSTTTAHAGKSASISSALLALAGKITSVTASSGINIPPGVLTFAGKIATAAAGASAAIEGGALLFRGAAITQFGRSASVASGVLSLVGSAVPQFGRTLSTTAGVLALAGKITLASVNFRISIPAGALALAGKLTATRFGRSVVTTAGALTLAGNLSSVVAGRSASIIAGVLSLASSGMSGTYIGQPTVLQRFVYQPIQTLGRMFTR